MVPVVCSKCGASSAVEAYPSINTAQNPELKARVLDVCDALERGDYETVGEMMYQTHFGMSKLYEVSCEELDFLNKLARKMDVTGSRVMGGGFGGCTINLVKKDLYQPFVDAAVEQFTAKFGHAPKVYDVVISDGARKLD